MSEAVIGESHKTSKKLFIMTRSEANYIFLVTNYKKKIRKNLVMQGQICSRSKLISKKDYQNIFLKC